MPIAWSRSAIRIDARGIEARRLEHVFHKLEQASADIHGKLGIPDRTGNHQRSERKEGRGRGRHLLVPTVLEVRVPEQPKEHFEWTSETAPAAQR